MSSSEPTSATSSSIRGWPIVALGFGIAIGLAVQTVREASWSFAWEFSAIEALLIGGLAFVLAAAPARWRWSAVFSAGLAGLLILASVTMILRFGTLAAERENTLTLGLTIGNVLFSLLVLTFFQTWQSVGREGIDGDDGATGAPQDSVTYQRFFGHIWENVLVTGVSLCFLGLFWLLLWLFAALFESVGISALKDLIEEPFFYWPATCAAVAVSVVFTLDLDRIVAALRSILFALFTVLVPVFLALSVAFLMALAFGGFARLSSLVSASTTLIILTCFGIVFVNAVIRDGGEPPAKIAQVSALLLLPCLALFCGFAVYAIGLRIEQHGLTPERIFVASATAVLTLWSLAYLACLIGRGRWMDYCRRVNIAVALLVAALVASLQSPMADPYRLSAENQLRRLVEGRADPATFDYYFLKRHLGQAGQAALDRLAEDSGEADAETVSRRLAALARPGSQPEDLMMEALADPERVRRLPPTLELPDDMTARIFASARLYLHRCGEGEIDCLFTTFDLTDGPGQEFLFVFKESSKLIRILVIQRSSSDSGRQSRALTVTQNVDRVWASLLDGDLEAVPTLYRDLRIGEDVIRFDEPLWTRGD